MRAKVIQKHRVQARCGAVIAFALCLLWGAFSHAVTEQDIYRVLEELSIGFDEEAVREGIIDGMLHAVDRRARILSTNDAALIETGSAIETTESWSEDIYYLRANGLAEGSGEEIVRNFMAWGGDGAAGLVLDLRGAGGNDLVSVERIANLFAPIGTPLYDLRDGEGRLVGSYSTTTDPTERIDVPMMIVVDSRTSGAGEVLAAVLQGENGVLLIGEQTRGHEGLMEVIPLTDTEFLYVATRWVLLEKNGTSIDSGVLPDIVIEEQVNGDTDLPASGKELQGKELSEKAQLGRDLMERVAGDAALRRATDILLGLKALGSANRQPSTSTNQETRTAR